jgi:acetyl-CoA carboxylase carboxyltransferase component
MSSKQLRGDFNYAWPTAEIAVMGAAGAIEVLEGRAISAIADPEEKAKFVDEKVNEYKEKFANPYQAASYGYIDDIIEPRNTRFRVIRAFQALQTKKVVNPLKSIQIFHYKTVKYEHTSSQLGRRPECGYFFNIDGVCSTYSDCNCVEHFQ